MPLLLKMKRKIQPTIAIDYTGFSSYKYALSKYISATIFSIKTLFNSLNSYLNQIQHFTVPNTLSDKTRTAYMEEAHFLVEQWYRNINVRWNFNWSHLSQMPFKGTCWHFPALPVSQFSTLLLAGGLLCTEPMSLWVLEQAPPAPLVLQV